MKINLNSGESLTAVLSGAHTTTAPTAKVDYLDSGTPRTTMAALTGATAVTLLSGPTNGVRPVDGVSIYNGDTAQITVTIKQVIDGTAYTITSRVLEAGERLMLDEGGERVTTSTGTLKTSIVAGSAIDVEMASGGQIVDSNGNELIQFPTAVSSAVNELTISNAATGNSPSIAASGGDTDINITLTPKGAGLTIADGPFQVRDSVAVTATVGGGTTGLIPAGSTFVVVTSDNVDKQISLPAASVGDEIWILVGATGCELISAVAAHKVNDVTVGATNEAALTATNLYWCKYVATNTWIVIGYTKLGAVQSALVPDSL